MRYTEKQLNELLKEPDCILCQLDYPRTHKEIIEWMKDNKKLMEWLCK